MGSSSGLITVVVMTLFFVACLSFNCTVNHAPSQSVRSGGDAQFDICIDVFSYALQSVDPI